MTSKSEPGRDLGVIKNPTCLKNSKYQIYTLFTTLQACRPLKKDLNFGLQNHLNSLKKTNLKIMYQKNGVKINPKRSCAEKCPKRPPPGDPKSGQLTTFFRLWTALAPKCLPGLPQESPGPPKETKSVPKRYLKNPKMCPLSYNLLPQSC